jgi:hypothetical protein
MTGKSNRVAAQLKRDIHCMYNVTQAYSCNHCCPGKAINRRHLAIVELGHLTRSGVTRLEV